MNRLRAGLLAVCIAAVSCVGVVGAQVANADTSAPSKIDFDCPSCMVEWDDFEQHDWNYWRQVIFGKDQEINKALTATSKSPLTSLTGIDVSANVGTDAPMLGNLCRSGYGCTIAGLAGAAMAVYGLFGPDGGTVETERQGIAPDKYMGLYHEPQFYASNRNIQCAEAVNVPASSMTWTASHFELDLRFVSEVQIYGCQARVTYATDCHRNGEWYHNNGGMVNSGGAVGSTATWSDQYPCGPGHDAASGWELRNVHVDMTQPGTDLGQLGLKQGFYWGESAPLTDGFVQATTRCQRPNGSQYSVAGALLPVAAGVVDIKPCNAGDTPLSVQTDHVGTDGTTRTPQGVQTLQRAAPADWAPDCKVAGSGCRWVVKVGGQPCTVGQAGCTDWTEHKQDAECFYGPYSMPLAACNWLERRYETQPDEKSIPATRKNMDGDPNTSTGPARQTTPKPQPSPSTTTSTKPNTDPSPRPTPSPSGSASPAPEPTPGVGGVPNPSDSEGRDCWPDGWSAFNPVQWVLMPLKCAFIPRESVLRGAFAGASTAWDESPPSKWVAALSDVASSFVIDGGSCRGPGMPVALFRDSTTIYPLDACSGQRATIALIARVAIGVSIVVSAGFASVRAILAGLGYGMGGGSS